MEELQNTEFTNQKPEKGTRQYLRDRLMGFARGIEGGIRNPLDMKDSIIEDVFRPAFNETTPDTETLRDGRSTRLRLVLERVGDGTNQDIDLFKRCGAYLTEVASESDQAAVDCFIDPRTGSFEGLKLRNQDSMLFKVKLGEGGRTDRDCYVSVTMTWKGQEGCVDKPRTGTGKEIANELKRLQERLESKSDLLFTEISFLSRPKQIQRQ